MEDRHTINVLLSAWTELDFKPKLLTIQDPIKPAKYKYGTH